jgi:pseudouridine synthase
MCWGSSGRVQVVAETTGERVGRYLARCGVASRRGAEGLIAAGRVTLNGAVVRHPATRVGRGDEVRLDGRRLRPEPLLTLVLHKPYGVVCTAADPQGRLTVLDLVPDAPARLYPVGRLDYDSEGLVLLSNDGALTAALLHPRHAVPRRYALLVAPAPDAERLARLRQGVRLSDGFARPRALGMLPGPPPRLGPGAPDPLGPARGQAWLEMVLTEGRTRQARRMCAAVGLDVVRLVRTAIGPLALGGLPSGAWRTLAPHEVASLRAAARGGPGGRGRRDLGPG